MLVFGNIISIDEKLSRVKIKVPDYDDYETGWIFVPQTCTVKDKSYNLPELDTLVAAVMDDEMQDGCIIGALYNDEDICVLGDKNIKYIRFEDGGEVLYDKAGHLLSVKAQKVKIDGDLEVSGDVSDKNGSMQQMRDVYNSHTHTCPDGNTGVPKEKQ